MSWLGSFENKFSYEGGERRLVSEGVGGGEGVIGEGVERLDCLPRVEGGGRGVGVGAVVESDWEEGGGAEPTTLLE